LTRGEGIGFLGLKRLEDTRSEAHVPVPVLTFHDAQLHALRVNVLNPQPVHLADPQTGAVQDGHHGAMSN
jgi:hypothetical protein